MFGIGMTELLVIAVIGLLVLGPKRLPEFARSMGRSLAEFRRASTDLRREFLDVADEVRQDPLAEPEAPPPGEAAPPETSEPKPAGAAASEGAAPSEPATPATSEPAPTEPTGRTGG